MVSLRLYVADGAPRAAVAQRNLERLLDRVGVPCAVEVVDVVERPDVAEREQILLTPTLERRGPPPRLRVAGDLSDLELALDGLGLRVWMLHARGIDDEGSRT